MTDYTVVENNITTTSNLDHLEYSLSNLIDNYQLLKLENEQLEHEHSNLNHAYQKLLVKQNTIEQRIKTLLEKLSNLDK